ncbi:efflux RND transporter permease subunit [Planctomicrobium piriforme]|uniref:Hydrophobic/amphiphilic exporter-1, HAE1 family n=1 Tax=Planctomicrobium piriforme TaxID=1576369 RepID=A0A1I3B076_9PLAN|nr:efflux RND transporter permease subunit [Planctomicrobium piriforme]SFH55725.1 hydrophobic/amphiphilic exporter-1, HAE1 family [Planctomicrobium piriforme]
MFSQFLRRPALAIVISIIILFLGGLSIKTLPISQFPSVAPPSVVVTVAYPGASANVLVDSVLVILEQAINGVPDMRYMASAATSAGEATIQIVFEPGTDPNVAVLNVQNRIQTVKNRLPPLVEREGIIVMQAMTSMLMYVNIYGTDPSLDQNFLYNYAFVDLLPEIKRVRGIGSAIILGSRQYAMRVWLDLDRMRAYNINSDDVMKAIGEQSMIGSPGRLGQATGKTSQTIEYVLTWVGRYNKPEQYENIILRANEKGEILRLKDVATVEMSASYYNIYSDIDGHPSAAIVLKQLPGTNAAVVIEEVKEKLKEIKEKSFPPGVDFEVSYDVSSFLDASIEQVLHTLLEAFVLVSLVVYLFLGDWRSTLIPTLAVPVSLIGTFFFLQMFGLSINLITLFALVLAIGVVVDDAIVVVEAVHAKMHEKHLSPYLATKEVIHEISGAIVAITLVMTAVFVPVTFMTGPVGTFYRQFGITMATSIVLSGVVALTLTPVLCAMILKPHTGAPKKRGPLGYLLHLFDRAVEKVTGGYAALLRPIVTRWMFTLLIIGGFAFGIYVVNNHLPPGFIPLEDQGMIYGIIQTPPGSTIEYTNAKSQQLQEIAKRIDGVHSVSSLAGYEVLTEGRGSNAGTCLINLKPWHERKMTSKQIIAELEKEGREMSNVKLEFFEPPAVPGFGAAGGVSFRVLDQTNTMDYLRLGEVTDKFMAELSKRKEVRGVFTFFASNYPQYEIVIDNDVAMQKGVSIAKAMDNLSIVVGSTWEQGFILYNQFYKVFVQAKPEFRRFPEDFGNMFVKNDKGEMVPYSAFMTLKKRQGLNEINRYNLYPSAAIQCDAAPGYSTGEAIQAIKEVGAAVLPRGYSLGWEGLAYDEANKGNLAIFIFLIVVVFVYLVLVGQYESFILPLAVILSLPVGIFGSFLFLQAMGLANDVYCQIGLVMLVGLLGKNAILIVEFAVQRRHEGASIKEAAIEGGKLRFRPILMTSFAFIAGLIPLVRATGPGAIGNRTIGTTAVGGMLLGTLIGVLVIPGLYYMFAVLTEKGGKFIQDETDEPLSESIEHHSVPTASHS